MEGAGRFGSHFVSGVRVAARCLRAGGLAAAVCLSHLRTNRFSNAHAYHRTLYLIHNTFLIVHVANPSENRWCWLARVGAAFAIYAWSTDALSDASLLSQQRDQMPSVGLDC
jgi:hypothetical protein